MLLRLLPDQIAGRWDEIKAALEVSLPPVVVESDETMNNILSAMLVGGMDCWLSYRKHEKEIELTGLVVTTITIDNCSGTRSLLIYVLFSPDGVGLGEDGWAEGYEALSKYARSVKCTNLSAYSALDHIAEMAESFGGDASYRYITVPLKGE